MKSVVFHCLHPFHKHILEPLYLELNYKGKGISNNIEAINSFKPDILVIADHHYSSFATNPTFIQTKHGVTSKNNSYAGPHSMADYICVMSEFEKNEFLKRGVRPKKDFWFTGYPPTDKLFCPNDEIIPYQIYDTLVDVKKQGRKVILFAPTWNPDLNSIDAFCESNIVSNNDFFFVIKPHPVCLDNHMEMLRMYKDLENVYLEEDLHAPVVNYMLVADMLIGDTSSAVFEYLILDRPILLFRTEAIYKSVGYDPLGIEQTHRHQIAHQFSSSRELPKAIEFALSDPQNLKDGRKLVKDMLYGDLQNGRSVERFVKHLENLL